MTNSPSAEHEETIWSGSVSQWHYAGKWTLVVLLLAHFPTALTGLVHNEAAQKAAIACERSSSRSAC